MQQNFKKLLSVILTVCILTSMFLTGTNVAGENVKVELELDAGAVAVPDSIVGQAIMEIPLAKAIKKSENAKPFYDFMWADNNHPKWLKLKNNIITGKPTEAAIATTAAIKVSGSDKVITISVGTVYPKMPDIIWRYEKDRNIVFYNLTDDLKYNFGKGWFMAKRKKMIYPYAELKGKEIAFVKIENGIESAKTIIPLVQNETPKNLMVVDASLENAKDGMIKGVNTDMEYRRKGSNQWLEAPVSEIKNLAAGIYQLRYAYRHPQLPSELVEIKVGVKSESKKTPEISQNPSPSTPSTPKQSPTPKTPQVPKISNGSKGLNTSDNGVTTVKELTEKKTDNFKTVEKEMMVKTENVSKFVDVSRDIWYEKAINYVSERGLMKGITEKSFVPEAEASRGMLVTVLYRLAGMPAVVGENFADVEDNHYSADAIKWATINKIADGYGNGKFGPNDAISREQLLVLFRKYAVKYSGKDIDKLADLSVFGDADQVADYAKEAMAWGMAAGLLKGRENQKLEPKGTVTRAEMAMFLMRFTETVLK